MKENAARAMRMSPRQANPTRNEPIVEKSDRASSPKSSPTSPAALCLPKASWAGQPTWMSAAAMMTSRTSPARRAAGRRVRFAAQERDAEQQQLERDGPRDPADERHQPAGA